MKIRSRGGEENRPKPGASGGFLQKERGSGPGLLPARKVQDETDGRANERRADPAEAKLGKRQVGRAERLDGFTVDGVEHALRQRDDKVVDRGDEGEAHRPAVDRAVVAEELAEQRQRDERDGERVEEHQHRQ